MTENLQDILETIYKSENEDSIAVLEIALWAMKNHKEELESHLDRSVAKIYSLISASLECPNCGGSGIVNENMPLIYQSVCEECEAMSPGEFTDYFQSMES